MTRHIRGKELLKTYDEKMWCFVRDIRICPDTGIGLLVTQSNSNPDMAACIDHFVDLLPKIEEIRVFNWIDDVAVPDMCYRRINGEWHAFEYVREHSQTR